MSAPRGIDGIEDIYELTPVQQGLLFHSLYEPRSSVYLEQVVCTLGRGIDPALLQQAFAQVVERHPVLRTAYHWQEFKKPLQVVMKRADVPWHTVDVRASSGPDEQRWRMEEWLEEDRRRPLRLDHAPVMRCALVRLSSASCSFIWTFHHLLLDGWSMAIVLQDLFAIYDGLLGGKALERPVPRPYRDYVLWRQQHENRCADFWRRYLKGVVAPTRISSRVPMNHVGGRHAEAAGHLSKEATRQLVDLARAERTTLSSVVSGALAFVLARHTSQHEVVFGSTVSGRPAELEQSERMVGLFINALPLRVGVDPRADLWPWLRQVQHDQLGRERFAHESLVDIQACSEIARGTPLFETLLVFENYPGLTNLSGDSVEVADVRAVERTNYPLTLVVTPGDTLQVRAAWYDESCPTSSAEQLLAHVLATLEAIASGARKVADLPPTSPAERELLAHWSAGPVVIDAAASADEWLSPRAERWDDLAVASDDDRLTHGQLETRANALAWRLRAAGAGPEVYVGIAVGRTTALLVAVRAVLKAGAAYVPIEVAHPPERVRWIVRNAGIRLMLCDETALAWLADEDVSLVRVGTEDADRAPAQNAGPDNLAYAIYTSGSTGFPKGCAVSRRALANLLAWYRDVLDPREPVRALILSSFGFDLTQKNLYAPLALAGSVHLWGGPRFDGRAICAQIAKESITLVNCTPSAFYPIVEAAAADDFRALESLRHLVLGGEPIVRGHLSAWLQSPRCRARVLNSYGPTECADVSVAEWIDRARAGATSSVPIGRPIRNTRVHVLDERMQPVPVGAAGELFIGGLGVGRGYLGRPRDTADRFVADPFTGPGERLYATGDIVRYNDDGGLEFIGRRDDQVKLRGHRIALGEIETVMRGHPGVRDVVVAFDSEDVHQTKVIGFIVPSGSHPPDADDLRRHARRWLPEVMIPTAWVTLPRLPLTDRGKVDRQRLSSISASAASQGGPRVEPQTALELELAAIWSSVLGVTHVGTRDNFFDLGGHSLNATLVISRIHQRLRVEVPLRTLFEAPTLAELAGVVATTLTEKATSEAPPLTALPRTAPAIDRRPPQTGSRRP